MKCLTTACDTMEARAKFYSLVLLPVLRLCLLQPGLGKRQFGHLVLLRPSGNRHRRPKSIQLIQPGRSIGGVPLVADSTEVIFTAVGSWYLFGFSNREAESENHLFGSMPTAPCEPPPRTLISNPTKTTRFGCWLPMTMVFPSFGI